MESKGLPETAKSDVESLINKGSKAKINID
jgi:hypothetical protein